MLLILYVIIVLIFSTSRLLRFSEGLSKFWNVYRVHVRTHARSVY